MGNVAGCCCYRSHDDKDLEPADSHLTALLHRQPPPEPAAAQQPAFAGGPLSDSEPAPEPQDTVHQWLLKVSGPLKGGGLESFAKLGGDKCGSAAATPRRIASIARPNRRKLSKGAPSERGSFLAEPQFVSSSQCSAVAADGGACVVAGSTDSSRAWAAAARFSGPEEESAANWAQLETVLGDLNAAVAALAGPEDSCSHCDDAVEEQATREFSPASSSNLMSDAGQKASTQESGLSEAEVFDGDSSDDDDNGDDAAEPADAESLYATTEDGQSTLQEFSGAEDTNPPSARPSPGKEGVEMAVAAAAGDVELRTTAAAASWAAERGLSLEGGGLEEMYKYF